MAILEPVGIGGVTVSNASLHNIDEIERLGVKPGDRVLVKRAGDVIPKVVKVLEHLGRAAFVMPEACPVCKTKVIRDDVSEWLETIYDRNDELERLTQETLRLEVEADVDRLLG